MREKYPGGFDWSRIEVEEPEDGDPLEIELGEQLVKHVYDEVEIRVWQRNGRLLFQVIEGETMKRLKEITFDEFDQLIKDLGIEFQLDSDNYGIFPWWRE